MPRAGRGRRGPRIRSRLPPSAREVSTAEPAKASTRSTRSVGSSGRSVEPGRGVLVSGSRAPGADQAELRRTVVGHHQEQVGAVGQDRVLGVVLDAPAVAHRPRGPDRSGASASITHTSRVSRFSAQITTRAPLRVARTLRVRTARRSPEHQRRPSSTGVPMPCRQTWWGR